MKHCFAAIGLVLASACSGHAGSLVVDASGAHTTIAAAMARARAGDTIIVKNGVYRETIYPKPGVVIEGEGNAIIKGSDEVRDWESLNDGRFVKRNWNSEPQQVFVDGAAMQQIGGRVFDGYPENRNSEYYKLAGMVKRGGIWPGRIEGDRHTMSGSSFFYDEKNKSLYLNPPGGTLSGKTVEVSVRPFLVHAYKVNGFTLRNLDFAHANASSVGRGGALRLIGNDITVERISVMWTDAVGMTIRGDNNVIRDSVFSYCGQLGVGGSGSNVRFIGNEMSHNNTRGFNHTWEAGGVKFMGFGGMQNTVFSRNRTLFNGGDGIWYDGGENRNNLIVNNVAAYNRGSGIHYEISYSGRIVNNKSFANKQRGIYVANSADTVVEHNLVAKNGLEGIAVNNEPKRSKRFPPNDNTVVGNIIAWSGKHALRLPAQSFPSVSDRNLFVGEEAPRYGIWEAPLYPGVTGLAQWQEEYGKDKNSWQKIAAIPADVNAKLKHEQIDLNWDLLISLASEVKSANPQQRPGPQ